MYNSNFDVQQALGFVITQASYVEAQVYEIQYPDIQYHDLVPIDTSAPPWAKSVTYFSLDKVGLAKWINGGARDIPLAEVDRGRFETTVELAGIGYQWNLEEINVARMLNINLSNEKAAAARRAAEEHIDLTMLKGDATKNLTGLTNAAGVTTVTASAGASTHTDWPRKTPVEIMADINNALTNIYTTSNTVEMADTLLLPVASYMFLANTQFGTATTLSDRTLMENLMRTNTYTARTGKPLMIRAVRGLETAGLSGDSTKRMVAYRKDPTVLKAHMPMPFQFLPVWQDGPMNYLVPGIFRYGGLDIRRPGAISYTDGI